MTIEEAKRIHDAKNKSAALVNFAARRAAIEIREREMEPISKAMSAENGVSRERREALIDAMARVERRYDIAREKADKISDAVAKQAHEEFMAIFYGKEVPVQGQQTSQLSLWEASEWQTIA